MAAAKKKKSISYNELRAEIRRDKIPRLYVFYGEEGFLIDKLLESLEETLIEPGSRDLDRVVIDGRGKGARADIERLRAEISSRPFLSRRKMIIFRTSGWFSIGTKNSSAQDEGENDSVSSGSSNAGAVEELLENLPEYVCLIFIEEKIDRRLKKLVQAIEKSGILAEISRQQPRMLKAWVEGEARRRSLQIDPAAAESLVDRCDSDMRLIWQELAKLFLYCQYAGCKKADLELIEILSLPDLKGSIFDLTDALSAGRTELALRLLDRLVSQKQPVQLIQFMLARHLRQLICAAELKIPERIASTLKVMPFVAGRLSQQARGVDIEVLEKLYASCYETDIAVKTGRISDMLGLELLLVTASQAASGGKRR